MADTTKQPQEEKKQAGDEQYLDDLDKYNIEQDKFESHSHSGKGRSKKEAGQNHHADPSGHTRKDTQKLINNSHNNAEKAKKESK